MYHNRGQSFEMERKYSVPSNLEPKSPHNHNTPMSAASEDLHAWSIYRQNLNSDFTDSALGSTDKSPLPYGNFQLRDTTVQSILSHPRYGPKSALGSNMYTYLKFGLPRVFPPNEYNDTPIDRHGPPPSSRYPHKSHLRSSKTNFRNPRDGSSGYDSSDNEMPHQRHKQSRKYRSDPDFRFQSYNPGNQGHPGPVPLAALEETRTRNDYWNKNRSISEANLLQTENYHKHSPYDRRRSVAEYNTDSLMRPGGHHGHAPGLPKADSHLSVAQSRRSHASQMRDRDGYKMQVDPSELGPHYLHPHLQARSLEVVSPMNRRMLLLQNVSFEIRGGEVLAIMATTEMEGTGLLNVMAGLKSPVAGDIILNGRTITKRMLKNRVAYVQCDSNLSEDMSAEQMLKYHYQLKRPTNKLGHLKISSEDRISVLLEDLGLEQVKSQKIRNMTTSEKRRLNVACHLLLDTDILLLDQPTKGMDIFDTFFLVEYLRQWANGNTTNSGGRIVILTLHPPTYEIFTMLSRVLLISAGRVMYSGRRKDMLPYFAMVEYPCPSFKNPSDYYLDLVTLDDLSAEAMLESSQRIEQLAEIFRRKQEPLSDPGPPINLPLEVQPTGMFKQIYVLLLKSMFYAQPNSLINWISNVMLALTLSLAIGAIFWDIPATDAQLLLNDRFGFHFAIMCVGVWPVLLSVTVSEVAKNKKFVERDIKHGMYSRFVYIVTKVVSNIAPSLLIWLAYLIPALSMTSLFGNTSNNTVGLSKYLSLMLLYFMCLQIFLLMFLYAIPFASTATGFASLFIVLMSMVCGYVVHFNDLTLYTSWLEYVSPAKWLYSKLLTRDLSAAVIASNSANFLCRNKQVQHQDIIIQASCPPPNGTHVLASYGFLRNNAHMRIYSNLDPYLPFVCFYVVCLIFLCFSFVLNCCRRNKDVNYARKGRGDPNKP